MKFIGVAILILLVGNSLLAQPLDKEDDPKERQRIESLKIAFITKKLNLSPEEAQRFWPVYNQFNTEMESNKRDSKLIRKAMGDEFATMSDPEIEKFTDEIIAQRRKEVEITEKYYAQFKKVLPIRKVALLYKSEREFRRQLLDEVRNRQGVGVRPGGGRPGGKP